MIDSTLKNPHIAEILDDNGNIKYRYTRYLSEDSTHWIRHGLFVAYYENGTIVWGGGYFCTGMTGGKKRRKTLSGADLSEAGARKNLHQLLL